MPIIRTPKGLSEYSLSPVELTNGEEGLVLIDHEGKIMEKNEALEVIQKLRNVYEVKHINQQILQDNEEQSKRLHIESRLAFWSEDYQVEMKGDKYAFPKPAFKEKAFRKDLKRHWSFHCDFCGKKVSSDADPFYYTITQSDLMISPKTVERMCSPFCATKVWDELVKNWIHEHDYEAFFRVDNQ